MSTLIDWKSPGHSTVASDQFATFNEMSPSKEPTNDDVLLSYYRKIGKILGLIQGITPFNVWISRCFIWLLYVTLLCLIIVFYMLWNSAVSHQQSSVFEVITNNSEMMTKVFCWLFGFYCATKNRSNWILLFENITEIGTRLTQRLYFQDVNIHKHILPSTFCYGLILMVAIIDTALYTDGLGKIFTIISYSHKLVIDSQLFLINASLYEFCGLLDRRYDYLTDIIDSTFDALVRNRNAATKAREIERICKSLHVAVEQINAIFGKYTLLMIFNSTTYILIFVAMILRVQTTQEIWMLKELLSLVTNGLVYCIYTIVMIMSYDKVEKSALRLLDTCQQLQATAENEFVAKELQGLSICIRNLMPKFTAAGFFDVNQRLIPGFLSAVTAYVIILIQFRT